MNYTPEYLMQSQWPGKAQATIYLIRHGSTSFNTEQDEHVRGWSDVALNTEGVQSAHAVAKFLMDKGIKDLYSSDLLRAKQTADILGLALNLSAKTDYDLRPWDVGILAGQPMSKVLGQLQFYTESFPNEPIKGGERYSEFYARAKNILQRYAIKASQGNQAIAIVTHSLSLHVIDNIITHGKSPVMYENRLRPGGVIKLTLADKITAQKVF